MGIVINERVFYSIIIFGTIKLINIVGMDCKKKNPYNKKIIKYITKRSVKKKGVKLQFFRWYCNANKIIIIKYKLNN